MATIGLSAAVYPEANKAASGKIAGFKASALTFIHQESQPKVFLTINDESKIEVETTLVRFRIHLYLGETSWWPQMHPCRMVCWTSLSHHSAK
jgi:hypothetical protein